MSFKLGQKIIDTLRGKKTYFSCGAIRNSFNFYRSNKISSCCFTTDDSFIISNIADYNDNLDGLIDDIINFQNKLILSHKNGCIPEACKNCTNLKKQSWGTKVKDKFGSVAMNHYKTCNLKCNHCGYRENDLQEKDSDSELILKVLKKLKSENKMDKNFSIALGGGEPSINKGVENILKYCLENHIGAEINSNCAKYSEIMAEGAKQGLFELILTPDAGSKDVYLKIKGADFFDTAWENIRKYVETTGDNYIVKFIIEEGNKDDVENMIEMCRQNNVKNVALSFDIGIEKKDLPLYKEAVNKFIKLAKENNFNLKTYSYVPKELIEV